MESKDFDSGNKNVKPQQQKIGHFYNNKDYYNVLRDYKESKDFDNVLANQEWLTTKLIPEDEDVWYFLYDLLLAAKKINDRRCIVVCHEFANRKELACTVPEIRRAILENGILSDVDCVDIINESLVSGIYETAIFNIIEYIKERRLFSAVINVLNTINNFSDENATTKNNIAKRFINAVDDLLLNCICVKKEKGVFGNYYSTVWNNLMSDDIKKYLQLRAKYTDDKIYISKEYSPRQREQIRQNAQNKAEKAKQREINKKRRDERRAENKANKDKLKAEQEAERVANEQAQKDEANALIVDHNEFIKKASLRDDEITADIGEDKITIIRIDIEDTEDNKLHYSVYCKAKKDGNNIGYTYNGNRLEYEFQKYISCNGCEMKMPENSNHTCKFDIVADELDELEFKVAKKVYKNGYYVSPGSDADVNNLYKYAASYKVYYRLKEKRFI